MNRVDKRQGFTLIELMLAMTFISILLIAIAMTVIQISHIYTRGVIMKEANQAGSSIASELQRSIGESAPFKVDGSAGSSLVTMPGGGRLCTSRYAYVWNYGPSLNDMDQIDENKYAAGATGRPEIRFVKVSDSGSSYCLNPAKDIISADATELLSEGDYKLAIQKLSVVSEATAIDTKTRQQLYSITFFVGTNETDALIADRTACKGPGQPGADIAYCSVQEFNITARAGNAVD